MKRISAIILSMVATLCLCFGLVACNSNNDSDKKEISNTEKALAVIGTFVSGDKQPVLDYMAENYIQHNPDYATGRAAFIGSIEYLATAPSKRL